MTKGTDGTPSLLSRLRQKVSASSGRRHHRAIFIAMHDEIAEALGAGYTLKAIWELLREEGRLAMSYATFRAHCKAAGLKRVSKSASASPRPTPPAPRQVPGFFHPSTPDVKAIYGNDE
jgi:hypothetical protein